ncbi:hypothetical protein PG984_013457 [Apiospora sp. TS-2023a]
MGTFLTQFAGISGDVAVNPTNTVWLAPQTTPFIPQVSVGPIPDTDAIALLKVSELGRKRAGRGLPRHGMHIGLDQRVFYHIPGRFAGTLANMVLSERRIRMRHGIQQSLPNPTLDKADQAWPYSIQAFPLQIPASTVGPAVSTPTSDLSSPAPSTTAAKTAEDDTDMAHTLSRGQVAGISVGAIAFLGLIITLFVMQVRRRRRRPGQPELPADDAHRAELEGSRLYPEMESERKPVEAPGTEGQYFNPGIDKGADCANQEGKSEHQPLPDPGKGRRISIG